VNFECSRVILFSGSKKQPFRRAGCIIVIELDQTDFTDDCRQVKYVRGFHYPKKIAFIHL